MKTDRFDKKHQTDRARMRALIQSLPESEFDGHTDFQNLSPGQRLQWLAQSVRFAWAAKEARDRTPGTLAPA